MKEIRNRVIKQELVNWREMEWIQGELKEMTKEGLEKLIHSILTRDIVKAFHVWEHDEKLNCLDGNHLKKALEEIEKRKLAKIPDRLKADFIDCKDMRDAAEMVLVYSAVYTRIVEEGYYDYLFQHGLADGYDELMRGLNFFEIDEVNFKMGWLNDVSFDDTIKEKEISEDDLKVTNKCPKCGYEW